ncbi:MAG: LacI family DNA-binding transcriptional regulator [Actinomycetaceae bacterium]|nr:LacI family transcriptional regulator [Arcanobacterium sp.]MDD7505268.1 LacI family DNA-binding transcriptional regulator [Actinomycetaceae bacterium]MDY6144031.1 LacI family DNA-binding transcriptional regulator [Arcanobacterium sp.]
MTTPDRPAVTIRDIAKELGVGTGTVSRALNDAPGVSQTTRKRVLTLAEQMNYRPNPIAQNLRRVGSSTIAVLMKGPDNPFFLSIISALEAVIRAHGYSMTLVRVPHGVDEITYSIRSSELHKPAGIIFLGGKYDHDQKVMNQLSVPAVLCTFSASARSGGVQMPSVSIDEYAAMQVIADHLLERGHRTFAIVASDLSDDSVSAVRLKAVVEYLTRLGYEVPERNIAHGDSSLRPYTYHYGYEVTKGLVRSGVDFTALITFSDVLAIGAQRAIIDSGKHVPDDVAVTGFDGIELARYTSPSITTIVQPVAQIVDATCSVLFDMLDGKQVPRHINVEPQLRIGESTGGAIGIRACGSGYAGER